MCVGEAHALLYVFGRILDWSAAVAPAASARVRAACG